MFETPDTEAAFLDVADATEGLDVITANAQALAKRGVLGDSWILPPPHSLDLPEGYRHCFMEYERRATTPRRVRARLENYRRYFQSGYARRDHGGELPLVLFVFENPDDEDAFMDAASYVDHAPFASSNLETIAQRGILADTWLPPAPEPWERLELQRLVRVPLFR